MIEKKHIHFSGLKKEWVRRSLCCGLIGIGLAVILVGMNACRSMGPDRESFTFIVASDPHVSETRTNQLSGSERFKAFLHQVSVLRPRPDFIFLAGDLHVAAMKAVLAETPAPVPLHVTPGNHEGWIDRTLLRAMFPKDFTGNDFYAFSHKGCRFIVICDADAIDHTGHFSAAAIKGKDQKEWLRAQFEAARTAGERVFLVGHIPPQSDEKKTEKMHLAIGDAQYLRDLIREYKPMALFFGHLHRREEFAIGTTPVYVVPSLNWNFDNDIRGFYVVTVDHGNFSAVFIPSTP